MTTKTIDSTVTNPEENTIPTKTVTEPVVFDHEAHLAKGPVLAAALEEAERVASEAENRWLEIEADDAYDLEIAEIDLEDITDPAELVKARQDLELKRAELDIAKRQVKTNKLRVASARKALEEFGDGRGELASAMRAFVAELTGDHPGFGFYAIPTGAEANWAAVPVPSFVVTEVGEVHRHSSGLLAGQVVLSYIHDQGFHRSIEAGDIVKAARRYIRLTSGSSRDLQPIGIDHVYLNSHHSDENGNTRIDIDLNVAAVYPELPEVAEAHLEPEGVKGAFGSAVAGAAKAGHLGTGYGIHTGTPQVRSKVSGGVRTSTVTITAVTADSYGRSWPELARLAAARLEGEVIWRLGRVRKASYDGEVATLTIESRVPVVVASEW